MSLEIPFSEQMMYQYSMPETGNDWGASNLDPECSLLERREDNLLANQATKETKEEKDITYQTKPRCKTVKDQGKRNRITKGRKGILSKTSQKSQQQQMYCRTAQEWKNYHAPNLKGRHLRPESHQLKMEKELLKILGEEMYFGKKLSVPLVVVVMVILLPALNAKLGKDDMKENHFKIQENDNYSRIIEQVGNVQDPSAGKDLTHLSLITKKTTSSPSERDLSLLELKTKKTKGCKSKSICKKYKGACSSKSSCEASERLVKKGCKGKSKPCICCAPKCKPTSSCRSAGGYCVEKKKKCRSPFIYNGECIGKKCGCCAPPIPIANLTMLPHWVENREHMFAIFANQSCWH
ncbi:unnamed protein product, partial [Meganyctiphanes norvegica]